MPVAEMPGDADQMMGIGTLDLKQRLRRRHHLDQPAVLQHQRVAPAKCDGVLKVKQEFQAARTSHGHSAPVTVVEIEHDGVGCRCRPAMLPLDLGRADHAFILWGMISAQTLRVCRREKRCPLFRIMP